MVRVQVSEFPEGLARNSRSLVLSRLSVRSPFTPSPPAFQTFQHNHLNFFGGPTCIYTHWGGIRFFKVIGMRSRAKAWSPHGLWKNRGMRIVSSQISGELGAEITGHLRHVAADRFGASSCGRLGGDRRY